MSQALNVKTFQVLGDSYAVRFINFFQANPGLAGILQPVLVKGISGARISDFKVFIKLNRSVLQEHLPLLIFLGTNDFLADADLVAFKNAFLSFLRRLRLNYPTMVLVFTTLPYYPRIRNVTPAMTRLLQVNRFLLTLRSNLVKVIELPLELSQFKFFHAYYGNSRRRDGIHFNGDAFQKLIPLIEKALSPLPT